MKKFIILILIFTILFFGTTTQTFAHDELTDHGITGILHTDPDDDPIAKSHTNIFLELKQQNDKVDVTQCWCQLVIREKGETLLTQQFTNATDVSGTIPITSFSFPKEDEYQIVITGSPKKQQTFLPFKLSYEIKVGREDASTSSPNNWWQTHTIPLMAIFSFISIGTFLYKRKRI